MEDTWLTTPKIEVLYSYKDQFYPSDRALELYNELALAAGRETKSDPFELGDRDDIPRHDPILLEVFHSLNPSGEFCKNNRYDKNTVEIMKIPKKYEDNYVVLFDEYSNRERVRVYHSEYVVEKIKKIVALRKPDAMKQIENVLLEPMYSDLCFNYA